MGEIKLGNSSISYVYLGNSPVSEMYLGADKIYPVGGVALPYKYWLGPNAGSTSLVKYSSNFGPVTLTINELNGATENVAMSNNGQYIFIAPTNNTSPGSYIRVSSDGGVTFNNSTYRNTFRSICCSTSGQYVLACSPTTFNWSYIAVSSDYGASFSPKITVYSSGIAMSKSGQFQFAAAYANGTISQYSTDYGATWTNTSVTFGNNNNRVRMSGDGKYVYMWQMGTINTYWSENYGANFELRSISANPVRMLCVSEDGKYVYIAPQSNIYPLMKSDDYGVTFSNTTGYGPVSVYGVNCSFDGKYVWMYVGTSNNVLISDDYGVTWTTETFGPYSVFSVMSR